MAAKEILFNDPEYVKNEMKLDKEDETWFYNMMEKILPKVKSYIAPE